MEIPKKVVIAIDTSLESNQLKSVSNLEFIKNGDVTFVHLVKDVVTEEDKIKIEEAVLQKMKQMSQDVLPLEFLGLVRFKCLFAFNIKEAFCRFLTEERADLAIVTSCKRHHILDISFGDYISSKSSCAVLVIKNKVPRLKNVVIGIKFEEEADVVTELSKVELIQKLDITLIHISRFNEFNVLSEFDLSPFVVDEQKLVVEKEVLKRLEKIKTFLSRKGFSGQISFACEFSNHVRHHFVSYLNKSHSDFVIVFRDKKKNIRGSFVRYLLHHADIPVLVLNPLNKSETLHFHPYSLNRLGGIADTR